MSDAVAAAIEAAKAAAAAAVAAQANNLPATTAGAPGTAVATPRGKTLTMDDMQGSINVDSWLKVKEHGLEIEGKLVTVPVKVVIDMAKVAVNYSVKFGNPAVYLKTYDRVTCVTGGSWADALARAQGAQPGAREYRSADVPMTLVEDVVVTDPKSKQTSVVLEAGKTLGNSLSTTNWGNWENFYRECAKQGLHTGAVTAEISAEGRSNKAGNKWGVIAFTLLGSVDEVADAA